MYSRPSLFSLRQRLSAQLRQMSEPSTSRDSSRNRRCITETVLRGHSSAVDELEIEIEKRERMRMEKLKNSENPLLNRLLPHLQRRVLTTNAIFVPVGSTVTGLASSHSDLDVVLFPISKINRSDFVKTIHSNEGLRHELMSVLRSAIVHSIQELDDPQFEIEKFLIYPGLKSPLAICKFVNGTSLDISIPNETYQSIRNTHLMKHYAETDARLSALLIWLRAWSSSLGILDSKSGLLSTYHLLLLAVHFLQSEQCLSFPVLPVLYQTHKEIFNASRPIDDIVSILHKKAPDEKIEWSSSNSMRAAELVVRFIFYYSELEIVKKEIHLDKGMARKRINLESEQPAIYDPYSTSSACKSIYAVKALKEAAYFTLRRMRNGFMMNPFEPDFSYGNFMQESQDADWRIQSIKRKLKMRSMDS